MDLQNFESILIPLLILSFFAWRFWKFKKIRRNLPRLLAQGAVVVDVRSPQEFSQGARPGSINIPLNEFNSRAKELDKNKTILLCCASGSRSAVAVGILKKNGFSGVINAGSWKNTLD